MASRSSTSSPDPLGYPGDPEYLLSSARKPFSRQSMSPQKGGTPRRLLHQKSHQTLKKSPRKNGQLIPLGDLLLPSTPSGNSKLTRFDERSLSPTKAILQSDGNISPWRIRVTVEAEQEEDEVPPSVNGKRKPGPWIDGKTVKVPLKGTSSTEPTPKRRRRRKSKSNVAERPPTPMQRRNSTGTKPTTHTTGKVKKIRPSEDVHAEESVAPTAEGTALQSFEDATQDFGDIFLDIAADPDMDDDDEIVLMDQNNELAKSVAEAPLFDDVAYPNLSTKETKIAPLDRRKSPTPQDDSETPPSPLPSGLSPINVVNAGRTPRPKRTYPTPTSSSLVGDDVPEVADNRSAGVGLTDTKEMDPTEEHREFDSIMESEGFSMVSLNTLPSAKQRLRHLFENQASRVTPRESNVSPKASQHIFPKPTSAAALPPKNSTIQSPSTRSHSQLYEAISSLQQSSPQNTLSRFQRTPRLDAISSAPPPVPAPAPDLPAKRRPLARLCRVIRAGIALHGLLDPRRQSGNLQTPFSSPITDHTDDMEATRQRLDHLFQDLNMETRRELRAGVRFGEELAKRLRRSGGRAGMLSVTGESTRLQEASTRLKRDVAYPDLGRVSEVLQPTSAPERQEDHVTRGLRPEPSPIEENIGNTSLDSFTARREAEWRRERAAVSREIELANESRVIVINSDDGASHPIADLGVSEAPDSPSEERAGENLAGDDLADKEEENDDRDDYGEETDIWQQAAREPAVNQTRSPSLSHTAHDEVPQRRTLGFPSPRAGTEDETSSVNNDDYEMVPLSVHSSRKDAFPELAVGKSKMAQYRDSDASLSPLLGTPESATRRFYEGEFRRPNVETAQHRPSPETLEAFPRRRSRPTSPEPYEPPIPHDESSKRGQHSESAFEPAKNQGLRGRSSDTRTRELANPHLVTGNEEGPLQIRGPSVFQRVDVPGPVAVIEADAEILEEELEDASEDDFAENNKNTPSALEPPEQTSTVTWFNKLTSNLAPAWLTSTPAPAEATNRKPIAKGSYPDPALSPIAPSAPQPPTRTERNDKGKEVERLQYFEPPLEISGYFTNDHYTELREVYRQAKRQPESFKYFPTEERKEMIGQWMWSADGQHRRQVTEIQLMIVDRFRQNLIRDHIRHGGDGAMEWSEEDILWRLFSIIVGEHIRKQRREQQLQQRLQR